MSHRAAAKTSVLGWRRIAVVALPPASAARLDRLAREVAECCVERTLRRLHQPQTNRMGLAELRGYTRARAAAPVGLVVREYARQDCLPGSAVRELTARALERTVHAVVRHLTQPRTVTLAQPGMQPLRMVA